MNNIKNFNILLEYFTSLLKIKNTYYYTYYLVIIKNNDNVQLLI